jgi:hypothetical protein
MSGLVTTGEFDIQTFSRLDSLLYENQLLAAFIGLRMCFSNHAIK